MSQKEKGRKKDHIKITIQRARAGWRSQWGVGKGDVYNTFNNKIKFKKLN